MLDHGGEKTQRDRFVEMARELSSDETCFKRSWQPLRGTSQPKSKEEKEGG